MNKPIKHIVTSATARLEITAAPAPARRNPIPPRKPEKEVIVVNGIPLAIKVVSVRKPSKHERGVWDLVLTNTKEDVRIKFFEFFTYTGGYDQGSASSYQWYCSNKLTGGGGNGNGRSSQSTPKVKYEKYLTDSLTEMLNDPNDYHWDTAVDYTDIYDPDNKLGLANVG